jgi:hypothetical protein
MKSNEIFIIGGAILAAILLFKGQASSSASGSIPFISPLSNVSSQTENKKAKVDEQLKSIFNIETKIKDESINLIQKEIDLAQKYITKQQSIARVDQNNQALPYNKYDQNKAYLYRSDVAAILEKYGEQTDQTVIQYYEDLYISESAKGYGGSITGGKSRKFPKLSRALTNLYERNIAKRNIAQEEIYQEQRQDQINLIQEEYQTRFGSLSRYG